MPAASLRFHDPRQLGVVGYLGHWSLELDPFTYPDGGDKRISALMVAVPIPGRANRLVGFQLTQLYDTAAGADYFPNGYSSHTVDWVAGISLDSMSLPDWLVAIPFLIERHGWGAGKIPSNHVYVYTGAGWQVAADQPTGTLLNTHFVDLGFTATIHPASAAGWQTQFPEI